MGPLYGKSKTLEIGGNLPITNVTWKECICFCNILNDKYSQILPSGYQFSLPTEAQWEYSCRANTVTSNYFSGFYLDILKIGWVYENSKSILQPVMGLAPNKFGLYDMLGNVQHWCYDYYEDYRQDHFLNIDRCIAIPYDTNLKDRIDIRTIRGTSYLYSALSTSTEKQGRSAYRYYFEESDKSKTLGFRVALRKINKQQRQEQFGITKAKWGLIEFGFGKPSFTDAICNWLGHYEWNWQETGTHHSPGIQVADIIKICDEGTELLILSTGYKDMLQIAHESIEYLQQRKIPYVVLNTEQATRKFNHELYKGTKVAALLHSTC